MLLLGDLVAVQSAILVAMAIVQVLGIRIVPGLWSLSFSAAAAISVAVPAVVFALYDHAISGALERLRVRVYIAAALPWVSAALLASMQAVSVSTIEVLGIAAAVYVPFGLIAEAAVRSLVFRRLGWRAHALVVGSGALAQTIAQELSAKPELGLRPIGYCGEVAHDGTLRELPRLGSVRDAARLGGIADVAFIALSGEQPVIDAGDLPFERIVFVPGIDYPPVKGMRSRALGWIADLYTVNDGRIQRYQAIKRLLDLLICIPLLLLSLPVMFVCGLAICCISPGPVLYSQRRVGWQGRAVTIFKLRSMWPDAAQRLESLLQTNPAARREWETYVKLTSDPRVLPFIGNFIRRTSIDELPQLWNVIRGDISLVGPRPFPSYHVERFNPEFQRLRSSIRPGLTGLWQVTIRNSADLRQQQMIDTFYIRNQSLWLDLYILFLTIPAVLSTRGAR
jgi:lipopolysaccharide/colanic/teichoic acid biosynthesis glycosyltransferase